MILFLSAAKPQHDLRIIEGTWKRIGDSFAGMVVIVNCDGFYCSGILTEVPEQAFKGGFRTGDMKWRKVHTVDGNFFLEDYGLRDYVRVNVEFISPNEIRLWSETYTGFFCVGEEQYWRRVAEV
jgi:hypothetical protein